ncbi:MAG: beta-ketoacyl-[acyl-carrier-protein] synthase family protein, partial [Fuerstiella sp.]|nr:beta-ketoacyl-[acyl-carrier-protein] synthase family protein [Fuerstiella sp.]
MSDLKNERTRIVITGLGAVCSAGRTADQLWQTLNRRQSGNNHTTSDVNEPGHQGTPGVAEFSGTIKDFGDLPDAKRKFIRKSLKLMNRETQMGVAAGQQA